MTFCVSMLRAGMVAPDEITFNYLKGRFRTEIRFVGTSAFSDGWKLLSFPFGWLVVGLCAQKGTNGTRRNGWEIERNSILQISLYRQWNTGKACEPTRAQSRLLCFLQYSLSLTC